MRPTTGVATQPPAKMSAIKYAAVASLLPTLTPKRLPTEVKPVAPAKSKLDGSSTVTLPPVAGVAANLDAKFAAAAPLSGSKRSRSESEETV